MGRSRRKSPRMQRFASWCTERMTAAPGAAPTAAADARDYPSLTVPFPTRQPSLTMPASMRRSLSQEDMINIFALLQDDVSA